MDSFIRRTTPSSARSACALVALILIIALAFAVSLASPDRAAAGKLEDKQAQADALQSQVDALNEKLAGEQERQRSTEVRLADLSARVTVATGELKSAQKSFGHAVDRLTEHAVKTYKQGDQTPTMFTAITQASSFADAATRLDAMHRVRADDSRIAADLEQTRARVAARRRDLAALAQQQVGIVAEAIEEDEVADLQVTL